MVLSYLDSLGELLLGFFGGYMGQGYLRLGVIMFLAGSVAPIPWELVLLPAGGTDLNTLYASMAAALGASTGGAVGYVIGALLGRQVLGRLRIDEGVKKSKGFLEKYGDPATLLLRSVQYAPYKTYNLLAGALQIHFARYMIWTVAGTLIRCYYMVKLGDVTNLSPEVLFIAALVLTVVSLLTAYAKKRP